MVEGPVFRPVDPKVRFPSSSVRSSRSGTRPTSSTVRSWPGRAPRVGLLRRAAHSERQTPHRPRDDADLQGHLPPLPDDDRTPRSWKAGWDCHGLPVEIEVEKRWDLRQARHRGVWHRSVQRALPRIRPPVRPGLGGAHAADRILDRHGRPLLDDGPRVHRVRVVVAEAAPRAGLLVESDKVTAYCPVRHGPLRRGGRARLRHGGGPEHRGAFPIVEAPDAALVGASLLVWTTTPWTLPANAGVAVDPAATYAVLRLGEGG